MALGVSGGLYENAAGGRIKVSCFGVCGCSQRPVCYLATQQSSFLPRLALVRQCIHARSHHQSTPCALDSYYNNTVQRHLSNPPQWHSPASEQKQARLCVLHHPLQALVQIHSRHGAAGHDLPLVRLDGVQLEALCHRQPLYSSVPELSAWQRAGWDSNLLSALRPRSWSPARRSCSSRREGRTP